MRCLTRQRGTMTRTRVVAPYKPLPWSIPALADKSPVLLATGSAGGGKSRFAAEKINAFMMHYPGARGLLVRKAREFATKSMVPLMRSVIGDDYIARYLKSDLMFEYANGSRLAVGGMKDDSQREAIRSIFERGGLDMVWIEEANSLSWEDYQEIRARMRGLAASWRQIILTTNPGGPTHWINTELIVGGGAAVYYSGALDNPHNPPDYIDTLNTLTGVQYQRLVLGKWVQSEGVVYDTFLPETHVTEDAEYDPERPVYWGVDDGYAEGGGVGTPGHHPRVVVFANLMPDGSLHVFDEYYQTQTLPEVTIRDCLERPYKAPSVAMVDSSATELRRRLSDGGLRTLGATHPVHEGIKVVRRFLGDGNDVVNLRVHPRCKNLIREMQSYQYADSKHAAGGEPKPEKINDHAPDALRYLLWYWR